MRADILALLDRRDRLPADPRARAEWLLAAIELLLRAELMRQPAAKTEAGKGPR